MHLEKPVQLAVSMQNNIFVIDGNQIIMFDQYGNGTGKITGIEEFKSIRIIFEWLTVTSDDKIYTANLRSPELNLREVFPEGIEDKIEIVSALIFNNKLYLLSKKEILIFNRI